jgi:hypothetical protein
MPIKAILLCLALCSQMGFALAEPSFKGLPPGTPEPTYTSLLAEGEASSRAGNCKAALTSFRRALDWAWSEGVEASDDLYYHSALCEAQLNRPLWALVWLQRASATKETGAIFTNLEARVGHREVVGLYAKNVGRGYFSMLDLRANGTYRIDGFRLGDGPVPVEVRGPAQISEGNEGTWRQTKAHQLVLTYNGEAFNMATVASGNPLTCHGALTLDGRKAKVSMPLKPGCEGANSGVQLSGTYIAVER